MLFALPRDVGGTNSGRDAACLPPSERSVHEPNPILAAALFAQLTGDCGAGLLRSTHLIPHLSLNTVC